MFQISALVLLGQGTVNFANTTLTRLTTNSTAIPPPGSPPNATGNITGAGNYTIGLYIAPAGTTDPNAFTLVGPTALNGPIGGLFNGNPIGGLFVISGNTGQPIAFQVRAWSTYAGPTYEAAFFFNGVRFLGVSAIGQVTPSTNGQPSILFGTGAGQVGGFILTPGFPIVPPQVSINSPTTGSLFPAPANVPLHISYYQTEGGAVSLLELFTNGVIAAQYPWPPTFFSGMGSTNVTLSNLTAGHYTLRARASSWLMATSTPVIVRVADRPVLEFAPGSNGPIQFHFNSATGINYVVESGTLTNFSRVITNPGTANPITYSETNGSATQRTYRVRLQ